MSLFRLGVWNGKKAIQRAFNASERGRNINVDSLGKLHRIKYQYGKLGLTSLMIFCCIHDEANVFCQIMMGERDANAVKGL